jgi:tetratricopeptide (TPR) repeat protein
LLISSGCFFRQNETHDKLIWLLESGNEAFQAKQYDKAIEFYDAGLKISPEDITFLNHKSSALVLRAVEKYNAAALLAGEQARDDAREAAKKDFEDAAAVSSESVRILKKRSAVALFILDPFGLTKTQALAVHAESMSLLAKIVDNTKADAALEAIHEYAEAETDEQKKLKAHLNAGKMLIDTYNGQKAFLEYKKILESNPDNLEAVLGVGMALSQSGQEDDLREAKAFLQKFVERAPQDHPSMATAKEILASL